MFETLENAATLRFRLRPNGPILVRAQTVGIDPAAADMEFQRTKVAGQPTVFLAGSGLKGVLRAHCERLLRTRGRFACDPTKTKDFSMCGQGRGYDRQRRAEDHRKYPHNGQCGACFTFGSLFLAGRFHPADAHPTKETWEATNHTEVRTIVGIDRQSGGSSGSVLFDAEVVTQGAFEVTVQGQNFSLWQLGLLLAAVEHLGLGLVHLGGCKSRGMGAVTVESPTLALLFTDRHQGQLSGVRGQDGKGKLYGLAANDRLEAGGAKDEERGLFRTLAYEGNDLAALRDRLIHGPLETYFAGGGG